MSIDPEIEAEIRKKVEEKFELRNSIQIFGAIYVLVMMIVWGIWFSTGANDHPWPIYPTMGMLIPLGIMLLIYYNKFGGGAERRERMIDAELARERERMGLRGKVKNDDLFYDEDTYENNYDEGEYTESVNKR